MADQIVTQIGGKYSSRDPSLFNLKAALTASGISVVYPEGDAIVTNYHGIGVTFDPDEKSFYDVEVSFFNNIKRNHVHIVSNTYDGRHGYMGESASVETAYAMLHDRPVVLVHPPEFSESAPEDIVRVIMSRIDRVGVARLDTMDRDEVVHYIEEEIGKDNAYDISVEDEVVIMQRVGGLLERYRGL